MVEVKLNDATFSAIVIGSQIENAPIEELSEFKYFSFQPHTLYGIYICKPIVKLEPKTGYLPHKPRLYGMSGLNNSEGKNP